MSYYITFHSHGNIWYQMAWYAAAWVVIAIICSLLMSFYVPICKNYLSPAVYNIIITVINGGVLVPA